MNTTGNNHSSSKSSIMKRNYLHLIYPLIMVGLVFIMAGSCKKDSDTDKTPVGESLKDYDGNVYHIVAIGSQTWMVENFKCTHYNDGSEIQLVEDNNVWGSLTTPAYCWYNNDISNKTTYGALYNWYAVNTGKLCPAGWHVPSDADWQVLINYLGADTATIGGKLKEAGTAHWAPPNTGATNSSGFTALPGGSHYTNGSFYYNGKYGWYWSTTESSATEAMHPYLVYNSSSITRKPGSKSIGFSVRCLKN
jgi:uncharacterized protein (TIGR02145 family)